LQSPKPTFWPTIFFNNFIELRRRHRRRRRRRRRHRRRRRRRRRRRLRRRQPENFVNHEIDFRPAKLFSTP